MPPTPRSTGAIRHAATVPDPRVGRARELRRETTIPERRLWRALRGRGCSSLKFRRQAPIGPYIVDFFDAAHQLVLELDGESHVGRADYDQRRQHWLETRGMHVFRIANDDVLMDLDAVLEGVLRVVATLQPARSPNRRRRPSDVDPSSGPAGHLLPQGEKGGEAVSTDRGLNGGSR